MKERDISYVSIMPHFLTPKEWINPYYALLAGEVSAKRESLKSSILTGMGGIAIFSKLCGSAGDVFDENDILTFQVAVLIQKRIAEEKHRKIISLIYDKDEPPLEFDEGVKKPADGTVSVELSDLIDELERSKQYKEPVSAAEEGTGTVEQAKDAEPGEKTPQGRLYAAARRLAPGITDVIRKGQPTYLMEFSVGEEDESPVTNLLREMARRLEKKGAVLEVESCSLDKWGNEELLANFDKLIAEDENGVTFIDNILTLNNYGTRMAIRVPVLPGEDAREKIEGVEGDDSENGIRGLIREHFITDHGISADREEDLDRLMSAIKFIPVNVEDVKNVNTTIDVMLDVVAMECDRYTDPEVYFSSTQDVEVENMELADAYKALLAESIEDPEDFMSGIDAGTGIRRDLSVNEILEKIFTEFAVMRIRKIDWGELVEWKKMNDSVLRSV